MPLAARVGEFINEIGLSWFLEGLSFDLVCLAVSVARTFDVDGTVFGSLHTRFPSRWVTSKLLKLPEVHSTVSRKRPVVVNVPLALRALPARTGRVILDQRHSIDEECMGILGPKISTWFAL